jgi:hypothetical protein
METIRATAEIARAIHVAVSAAIGLIVRRENARWLHSRYTPRYAENRDLPRLSMPPQGIEP